MLEVAEAAVHASHIYLGLFIYLFFLSFFFFLYFLLCSEPNFAFVSGLSIEDCLIRFLYLYLTMHPPLGKGCICFLKMTGIYNHKYYINSSCSKIVYSCVPQNGHSINNACNNIVYICRK